MGLLLRGYRVLGGVGGWGGGGGRGVLGHGGGRKPEPASGLQD